MSFGKGFVQWKQQQELTWTLGNYLCQTDDEEKDDEDKSDEEKGSHADCKEDDIGHSVGESG